MAVDGSSVPSVPRSSDDPDSDRCTLVSDNPTLDCCAPNSCWSRSTPNALGGSTAVRPMKLLSASNARAYSRGVMAASAPTESPDLRRPVTWAADVIVVFDGTSTKSPTAPP
jgi:hypothetical protein